MKRDLLVRDIISAKAQRNVWGMLRSLLVEVRETGEDKIKR